jgi:hypothetical protein
VTTVDYIGENGEILISNPSKQGKEGCRMFKFNKVFGTRASQGISLRMFRVYSNVIMHYDH